MNEKVLDTMKVGAANVGALGITLSDVNGVLTTISIGLAIAYTIWKWKRDVKKK